MMRMVVVVVVMVGLLMGGSVMPGMIMVFVRMMRVSMGGLVMRGHGCFRLVVLFLSATAIGVILGDALRAEVFQTRSELTACSMKAHVQVIARDAQLLCHFPRVFSLKIYFFN